MHISSPRHRLVLAAPIFALCIAAGIASGVVRMWQPPVASLVTGVIEAGDEQRVVEIAGGRLQLAPGARVHIAAHGVTMLHGNALVVADTSVTLSLRDCMTKGMVGGWFVSVDDAQASIAALTTPVRLHCATDAVVLPARMQRTTQSGASLQVIPPHFLRMHMPAVFALQRASASEERMDWLLLSLHPQMRTAAWILPVPDDISAEERNMRLMLLPLADRLPDAVPDMLLTWWADAIAAEAAHDTNGTFLLDVLPQIAQSVSRLRSDGYPARARAYATRLFAMQRTGLFGASQTVHAALDILATEDRSAPIVATQSSVPAAAPIRATHMVVTDAVTLVDRTIERLQHIGFMRTAHTRLEPSANTVLVSAVVFGTPTGDRLLEFFYSPSADTVSHIVWDGMVLPNSLPLEQFVTWLREQQ